MVGDGREEPDLVTGETAAVASTSPLPGLVGRKGGERRVKGRPQF
jgi:hypothetical protein